MKKRLALILLALGIVILLSPVNTWWIWLYDFAQNTLWDLLLDGLRIIGITIVLAGLLAPFEALGWWAGWYGGDDDKTTLYFNKTRLGNRPKKVENAHYIVYLDGIGKSSFKYSFHSARFLERLDESLPSDRILIKDIIPYSCLLYTSPSPRD